MLRLPLRKLFLRRMLGMRRDPLVLHSLITSSARSSSDCGMARPSALAVLRLITNSNFVGCSIGRSPGLAPLSILSMKLAEFDRRLQSWGHKRPSLSINCRQPRLRREPRSLGSEHRILESREVQRARRKPPAMSALRFSSLKVRKGHSATVDNRTDGTDLAAESSQGARARHREFAPDQASLGPPE